MAKASRRGIGKIAAGAIVIVMVAMVVGVGSFFGSQGPPQRLSAQQIISMELAASSTSQPPAVSSTTQSTCTTSASESGNSSTITVTAQFPPCGCTLADSNSNGSLYVSADVEVGDIVCMAASLDDSSGVSFSVTNSTGSVVFSTGTCIASTLQGAPPSTGISCTAYWDTSKPDLQGNPVESGTYLLVASAGSAVVLEAGFTLS